MNECIFRKLDCDSCKKKGIDGSLYCKKHHTIVEKINIESQEILKNIFANNTLNLYDIYKKNIGKSEFINILNIVLNKKDYAYINDMYNLNKKTISAIINAYYKLCIITNKISEKTENIKKINIIKRKWKRYIKESINKSENKEDPFTFDTIEEMPLKLRFKYTDNDNHTYIFNAVEFDYFLRNNGKWNPYNKKPISENIVMNLDEFIKRYNLKRKMCGYDWQTNTQAYTDVSQIMEKNGFYNDIKWFEKINYRMCSKIINIYRDISPGSEYFNIDFKLSKTNFVFDFCKEVIRLFENGEEHYLLCCNLFKALALNIEEFYNNIPSWLYNVESFSNLIPRNRLYYTYMYEIEGQEELYNILNTFNIFTSELDRNQ